MTTNPGYEYNEEDDKKKEEDTNTKWVDISINDQKDLEALEDDDNPQCGWFSWRPKCAQVFNGPKGYLFFVCMFVLAQGITVNGLVFVSITTLERRFNLPSIKSGWIASTYDFSVMCVIVFVTYFGERGHKPKFLACGAFIFAMGSIIFSLPHFLTGLYDAEGTEFDTCDATRNDTSICSDTEEDLTKYYPFFITGQVLHGLGAAPLYTLGVTYMDENVPPHLTSIFIGIFQAVGTLGPAIGFLVGGFLLDIYTDFATVPTDSLPIESDSPLWVGAWWLGFLITSGLGLCVVLPLSGFPKRLPGALAAQKERVQEVRAGSEFETRAGLGVSSLRDFPRAAFTLLKNPTYMFIDLAIVCEWFILAFISVFGPKYLESQFNVSAGNAALIAGLLVTPAGVIGNLSGGYLMKRLDLKVPGALKFIIGSLTASLLLMAVFIIGCDNADLAGVTVRYDNTTLDYPNNQLFNLTAPCNSRCQCDNIFDPVCGENRVMYYSSCYAGCAIENKPDDETKNFEQCACISDEIGGGNAVLGRCKEDCAAFVPFLIVLFFVLLFGFFAVVPSLTITLRSIDYKQRSFGLGLQSLLARALGSVPGPIAFGALIDNTCLLWEDGCNDARTCWMYNNSELAVYLLLMSGGLRLGAIICYSGALLTYKSGVESDKEVIKEEENTAL